VVREDLAVLRPTWYPAVLVEGTALVVPEREALLRTQQGIDAYADGIVAGLRQWVASRQQEMAGRQP
jgi:N-acetylmuramoyl-L-alanine amidase